MIKKITYTLIGLLFVLVSCPAWAWDSVGHRIIAAIAYENLTPTAKTGVDQLTVIIDKKYPPQARFLYISVLADKWRKKDALTSNWHFYNTPWTRDDTPTTAAQTPNLITAVEEIRSRISADPKVKQKAIDLAYLVHLVGDAHQPLHCINYFSHDFPQGDRGGNLFPLAVHGRDNLHSYWDQAARLLVNPQQHYPLRTKEILALAAQIEQQHPQQSMAQQIKDDNVSHWVAECFQIAKANAYTLSPNARPSKHYKENAADVASSQLALAGYRLAYVINQLFLVQPK